MEGFNLVLPKLATLETLKVNRVEKVTLTFRQTPYNRSKFQRAQIIIAVLPYLEKFMLALYYQN